MGLGNYESTADKTICFKEANYVPLNIFKTQINTYLTCIYSQQKTLIRVAVQEQTVRTHSCNQLVKKPNASKFLHETVPQKSWKILHSRKIC